MGQGSAPDPRRQGTLEGIHPFVGKRFVPEKQLGCHLTIPVALKTKSEIALPCHTNMLDGSQGDAEVPPVRTCGSQEDQPTWSEDRSQPRQLGSATPISDRKIAIIGDQGFLVVRYFRIGHLPVARLPES